MTARATLKSLFETGDRLTQSAFADLIDGLAITEEIGSSTGINTGDDATNSQYSGLVSNATHSGDVTGATALTVNKTAITGKTAVTAVGVDYILIADTSDLGNLKKALVSDIIGGGSEQSLTLGDVESPEPTDPAWTPSQISNLDGWWRPTPVNTGGLVTGQKVTTLSDLSGNNRVFGQTTYASKPVLVAVGNNYGLRFDGVDDALVLAGFPSRAIFESWIVFKWAFAVAALGASGVAQSVWGREATSGSRLCLYLQNQSGAVSFTTHNNVSIFVSDGRTRAAEAVVAYRTLFNSNGTTVTLSSTTPTLGSVITDNAASALSEGNGNIFLGTGNVAIPFYFQGTILEFGRTNGAMSALDRTLLNTYITTKYPGVI